MPPVTHGRPRVWTQERMYAIVRAFVLAEGRYPSVKDFEAHAHGLPGNSGTLFSHCKNYKALLRMEGIVCAPVSRTTSPHPWRRS